jgi:hypothetical protein
MNSHCIKATSRMQQYLKTFRMRNYCKHTATQTSEPNGTYDAVVIGGGMNVHISMQLRVLFFITCPVCP